MEDYVRVKVKDVDQEYQHVTWQRDSGECIEDVRVRVMGIRMGICCITKYHHPSCVIYHQHRISLFQIDMSDSDVQQWCHTMMILTLGIRDHSPHSKILIVKIELRNGSFHTRSCSGSTSRGSRGRRDARWTSRFTATWRLPSRSCTSPAPRMSTTAEAIRLLLWFPCPYLSQRKPSRPEVTD